MALQVELKPGERILIGECVITNGGGRARLSIDGAVPILREKDIMSPERADTPAKRIYLAVQLMYTSRNPQAHHPLYFKLMGEILGAAPSVWVFIEAINNHILTGNMYKALKEASKMIAYEKELLSDAQRGPSLRESGEGNSRSA